MKILVLVTIGMLLATPAKSGAPPSLRATNHLAWITAKIQSASDPTLYGTAVLLDQTPDEWIFATPAHVLPVDSTSLRLVSPIADYQERPVEVVGVSPGYDLAVLALKRSSDDKVGREVIHLLTQLTQSPIALGEKYHFGMLGFPGRPQFANRRIPGMYTELVLEELLGPNPPERSFSDLSTPYPLEEKYQCPPLFLFRCYEIPMMSWGFSGSALFVESVRKDLHFQLAGMVTHFRPLSELTYIIPWDVVQATTQRLMKKSQRPFWETRDVDGYFEWDAKGVKILRGPLAGSSVHSHSPSSISQPGGGGESSGGGGSPPGPRDGVINARGNFAKVGELSRLKEEGRRPSQWQLPHSELGQILNSLVAFRGVHSLFQFSPGVVLEKEGRTTVAEGYQGQPVLSLPDFLATYRGKRSPKIMSFPGMPTVLKSSGLGIHSQVELRQLRTPEEIRRVVGQTGSITNDMGFEFATELLPLVPAHIKGRNIVFALGGGQPNGVFRNAKFRASGPQIEMDFEHATSGEQFSLSWIGGFQKMGQTRLRYLGPMQYQRGTRVYCAHGTASLQWNSDEGKFSLKVILAYALAPQNIASAVLVTREQVNVEGIYLPLTP